MFWLRLLITVVSLGVVLAWLQVRQRAGEFSHIDSWFQDFLCANAREVLSTPRQTRAQEAPVVLVSLNEEQQREYGSWPPPPIDWHTLLRALRAAQPRVVVFTTPLGWGEPKPQFISSLAETLLPFTSVIHAVEPELGLPKPGQTVFMGDLESRLPKLTQITGDVATLTPFSALTVAPERSLLGAAELGVCGALKSEQGWDLPYAWKVGNQAVPSVLAQAMTRLTRTPYIQHRLSLGPGAAAYLREGTFLPLEKSGVVRLPKSGGVEVPVMNALDLMVGTLAEGVTSQAIHQLGQGKVIVIGIDHSGQNPERPRLAHLHAQALTYWLSLPHLITLSTYGQWALWSLCCLLALWLVLGCDRKKALWTGAGLILLGLAASYLAFQLAHVWAPPTLPSTLIAIGMVYGRLFGRRAS
jgi:CHASE2 domain